MRKKSEYHYTIFIEPCEEGGYFASCPSLPGCHVQGDTLEETLSEIRGAIDAYLADLKSRREPIPKSQEVTGTTITVAA